MTEAAEQAQAGAPQAEAQQEADDQVYCICRRPEAGFMVFCDGCEDWFHGDCVGIKKRQADKLSKYMCPNCAPPTPTKAAPVTPDVETSKSRSGRSIKKKKYDEEEFEYDFKSKDEDEDYEEDEDSEDEKPTRKATPKKVATPQQQHHHQQQPQQHHQQQQHHHLQQHTPTQQHHHQQQPPSMYYNSNTNHSPYAHPNHLNLVGHNNHTLPSYNLNPTLQAINSINNYALNPHGHISPPSTHHMQLPPHLMSPLSHTLPHSPQSQPLMGQMPISGLQGPPPGSKRSYPTTPQPTKSSPEAQPKMARRESFPPPGVKG